MKVRAPWRWHWGAILAFLAQCAGWAGALYWSTFFTIPLAVWVTLCIRGTYTEPRSPALRVGGTNAATRHRIETRYNGAQTTFHPVVTPSDPSQRP